MAPCFAWLWPPIFETLLGGGPRLVVTRGPGLEGTIVRRFRGHVVSDAGLSKSFLQRDSAFGIFHLTDSVVIRQYPAGNVRLIIV